VNKAATVNRDRENHAVAMAESIVFFVIFLVLPSSLGGG
jgi:hypothetical protein